jgi:hypothetical protein
MCRGFERHNIESREEGKNVSVMENRKRCDKTKGSSLSMGTLLNLKWTN